MQMDLDHYRTIVKNLRKLIEEHYPLKATAATQVAAAMFGFKSNEALVTQLKSTNIGYLNVAPRADALEKWLGDHNKYLNNIKELITKAVPDYSEIFWDDDSWDWALGFSVRTTPEEVIKENAREDGIELDQAAWEKLNLDMLTLEENMLKAARKIGISCRSEGHDSFDDLVGTCWVDIMDPKLCHFVHTALEEGFGEHWASFDIEGCEKVYEGLSDIGAKLLDAELRFFVGNFESGQAELDTLVDHLSVLSNEHCN